MRTRYNNDICIYVNGLQGGHVSKGQPYLLNHVFHGALDCKPLEFDGDELIGAHARAVGVIGEFFLQRHGCRERDKDTMSPVF